MNDINICNFNYFARHRGDVQGNPKMLSELVSDDYRSISKFDITATDTGSPQGHEGAEADLQMIIDL